MGLHMLLLFCIVGLLQEAVAFKEHEFKKCHNSGFCKRLRGKQGPRYIVTPSSVAVTGSTISAELKNTEADKTFQLQVTTYDSIIRAQVFEPGANRYQLPDILEAEMPRAFEITHKEVGGAGAMFVVSGQSFVIHFDPFQLEVPGRVVLNARNLFHVEHKRSNPKTEQDDKKDDDGLWEETFNGHKDSKPKGPQAVSLDISFPEALHVYGIPEHATSLSLKDTVGANITSEPYRLYNLDVFEYLEDSPFGLYGSIPYLVANSEEHSVGAFWLNAAEMYVDIEKTDAGVQSQWLAESGSFDLFLLLGPTPADLAKQFASLTGKSAMPQMFSIGYHQCRYAIVCPCSVYFTWSGLLIDLQILKRHTACQAGCSDATVRLHPPCPKIM
jgi:mannosyl-oligosaccharide alpha-1,3-glucosidase